jgi:hypothetical protein
MKEFFSNVYQFLENMGRVRAATHFARIGDYESAKKIMLG